MSVVLVLILVVLGAIALACAYGLGRCDGWLACCRDHAEPALDGWRGALDGWREACELNSEMLDALKAVQS